MRIGELLIVVAGIIWAVELIPQLTKTLKVKRTDDISIAFFIMTTMAYTCYTIGNAFLNNWLNVISHIPSFIFNIFMICLIVKYRYPSRKGDS